MNKKLYIAPDATVVLPELEDLMIGIEEGSATEVLTNDFQFDFGEYDELDNPGSSFKKGTDRTWDSL